MSVIILVFDSARNGSQKQLITTVDTDILVLEIAYADRLGVQKLWTDFGFGTKKKFRYLAAHQKDGNQNGQCSLKHQVRVAMSSNGAA